MKLFDRPVLLEGALEGAGPKQLWWRHVFWLWPVYSVGIGAVILTNFTEVAIPKLVQLTVDAISGEPTTYGYRGYFWILLATLGLQWLGRYGWRVTLAQQSHRTGARMKSLVWDRARYLPRHRLDTDLSPGELMNVATGDVGTARFGFGFTLVGTIDFVFLLILTTAAMMSIDVKLTLIVLAVYPLLPFLLDRLARRESANHKASQESLSALTDLAAQTVSTIRLQRITRTGDFWREKLTAAAHAYREKRFAVVKTSLAFIPIAGVAPIVSFVLLFYFGLQKVQAGEITVGAFIAFQSYILLIQNPLFELGVIISEWQKSFTSLGRVTNVYAQAEADQLRSGGEAIGTSSAEAPAVLGVRGLSFAYPAVASPNYVLHDFSMSLNAGGRVGIKGPIGAGKSTLVQILAGFERRFEGTVELYGRDIRSYAHADLRRILGLVPQKAFLFADSVRNNVKLHNAELTDDEIWRILDITCLRDDVEKFPQKLDSRLGEWGINLSGGQKQRMTLARTLAARPQVLFLDDCLSAVDTVTEEKILRNLDRELKGTTLVWVAHRSSTLKYCDQVIELEGPSDG